MLKVDNILLEAVMGRSFSERIRVVESKEVKKYNRRELLVHLAKIKQELVDVERYIKGCRSSFLCVKKNPTDWRFQYEVNKD